MATDRAIDGRVTTWSASEGGEVGHTPSLFPTRLMLKKLIDKPLEHTSTIDCSPHQLSTKRTPLCSDPASLAFSLPSLPQTVHVPPLPPRESFHPS